MLDPTAEVILSVEIRVKVTDTGINESKEVVLNEYIKVAPMKWEETYKTTCQRVATEMSGMVAQMEIERYKAE